VKGIITNQQYLQKLQNEVILVIHGVGKVDTTFFHYDGARPHTTNVILDVLHGVFGSHVLLNRFPEHFGCRWSWPPRSPDMNPCSYFLLVYLKDRLYRTKPHAVWCGWLTVLWFVDSKFARSKNFILDICSHEYHMHTNSP
jgi:hypothetical protein